MPSIIGFSQRHSKWCLCSSVLLLALGLGGWLLYSKHLKQTKLTQIDAAIKAQVYSEAARELEVYLSEYPEDSERLVLAARIARFLDRIDTARDYLQKAHQLMSSPTEMFQMEQTLLRAQSGALTAELEDQLWHLAENTPPIRLLYLQGICRAYIREQRLVEALQILKETLSKKPEDVQTLWLLGLVSARTGAVTPAYQYLQKVLGIDSGRDKARLLMARVCVRKNYYQQALAHLKKVNGSPWENQSEVFLMLLRTCLALDQLKSARQYGEQLLSKLPHDPAVLIEMGNLCLAEKNVEAAIAYAREVVQLKPGWPEARQLLVECLRRTGSVELQKQADIWKKLKQNAERLETLQTHLVPANPTNPDLLFELGSLRVEAGDQQQGLQEIYRALNYDQQHQPSHRFLTDYYQQQGDQTKADYHRSRIIAPNEDQ